MNEIYSEAKVQALANSIPRLCKKPPVWATATQRPVVLHKWALPMWPHTGVPHPLDVAYAPARSSHWLVQQCSAAYTCLREQVGVHTLLTACCSAHCCPRWHSTVAYCRACQAHNTPHCRAPPACHAHACCLATHRARPLHSSRPRLAATSYARALQPYSILPCCCASGVS
jgi:hypothetical protein